MKKEWAFANGKVLINFSQNYCQTDNEVLNSEGFRSILTHYLMREQARTTKTYVFLRDLFEEEDLDRLVKQVTKLARLLLVMDSKTLARDFEEYSQVYKERGPLRHFVEEIYTFWRNLERYAVLHDDKDVEGFLNSNFIEAKERFDKRMINFYRKISNNVSCSKPAVYRQVPAGTNAGLMVYDAIWPIPSGYQILEDIPFIKEIILEAPFISYPKRNKRDGIFQELEIHPLKRCGINPDRFFCYPAKVGKNLAYVFVERSYLTHGISLANLFELARPEETAGVKPDFILLFGAEDHRGEVASGYFFDEDHDIMVGYVSADDHHDYFGYMKKMLLTLNNLYNLRQGLLPIHGAMVKIELNDGARANVVIVGDSGAGKSESIEAFRALAADNISAMSIIFDDMGAMAVENGQVKAYGTEIGAFVRLDDLDAGYAFKELDRSIFMNPDKINARLITPISEYEEIVAGEPVDILVYANNYDSVCEGETAIQWLDDLEAAKKVFIEGKRMAKGTTTETGLTETFFANPFGPVQEPERTLEIMDQVFATLKETGCKLGVIHTQLGIEEMVKEGPRLAALDLFEEIKGLHKEVDGDAI